MEQTDLFTKFETSPRKLFIMAFQPVSCEAPFYSIKTEHSGNICFLFDLTKLRVFRSFTEAKQFCNQWFSDFEHFSVGRVVEQKVVTNFYQPASSGFLSPTEFMSWANQYPENAAYFRQSECFKKNYGVG